MQIFQGKSVSRGIAIGKIFVYKKEEQKIKGNKVSDMETEVALFHSAKKEAISQLKELQEASVKKIGETTASIFEVHQMMLEDTSFVESIENMIREQEMNVSVAVAVTAAKYSQMFEEMEDAYMRERSLDVKDISERLLSILNGDVTSEIKVEDSVIVVAQDLAPSETVRLDKDKVKAFVTVDGSVYSHTAILARTMNIPALVHTTVDLEEIQGKQGIVDGFDGILYVEPEEDLLFQMQKKQEVEEAKKEHLQTLMGRPSVTKDGKEIMLYANIGKVGDLPAALQNDAGGIGLFRSEFLYLEKDDFPTEEEQFATYKIVLDTMEGKRVIFRTLDIGADKQVPYLGIAQEENPALGYRGIRICLTHPEIFKTQLRALYRASVHGKMAIMYPMIISLEEVRLIRKIVAEVKEELDVEGIRYGQVEQGIMIETPAAVMISGELAEEVDFFSIGTNDLTQYALAIDRQNSSLSDFYDAKHPAILRMIQMVVDNAHAAGIWVGICGELGADTELTRTFLKMGVDEFSVSPDKILQIRKIVIETDLSVE